VEEAGQVLWDSGPETINSLSKLTKLLKERFSGTTQSEKFKMELRGRLRQPRETLTDLYRDIKRLMALGYPDLEPKAREVIAIDRFVDSLGDPELALKIRERTPTTLDEALRAGLRQEIWNKDAARSRPDEPAKPRAVRAAGEDAWRLVNQKLDRLQRQIDQNSQTPPSPTPPTAWGRSPTSIPTSPEMLAVPPSTPVTQGRSPGPAYTPPRSTPVTASPRVETANTNRRGTTEFFPSTPTGAPQQDRRPRPMTPGLCWNCGGSGHRQDSCPSPSSEEKRTPPRARPIRGCQAEMFKTSNVYLVGHVKGRTVNALLDTGSDVSLAPYDLVEKHRCRLRKSETKALKAANGSDVIIEGEATLPLRIAGRLIPTVVLISKDISETILGIGWIREHDLDWDFVNERVRFGREGEWVQLTAKTLNLCRRIYAEQDVTLGPQQMQMIPARATLLSLRWKPSVAAVEPHQYRKGIYVGRTLVPPEHDKARVCMMNTTATDHHSGRHLPGSDRARTAAGRERSRTGST